MFSFQEIAAQEGQTVQVEGFVSALRIQSKVSFIILRSRAQKLQCVATGSLAAELKGLSLESYVRISGTVLRSGQAPGGFELQVDRIELESKAVAMPLDSESSIGLKLEYPVARFRDPGEALILRTASEIERGVRDYLWQQGFVEIHTPKLMGSPSESGAEVFELGYFGQKAYLAQSPQFYKQMAILAGLEKIFEIAPVFRAEPSFSSRHSTEFISIDIEMEGVRSETELIEFECTMLQFALSAASARLGAELLIQYPKAISPARFEILDFSDAQKMLGHSGEQAMTAADERDLGEQMALKGVELVALTGVPFAQRPFYHMKKGEKSTHSFELLYRGVEITTGAIREHRHPVLMQQLAEKQMTGSGAEFYLDSFKLGAPPHGGFGLGLARLVALFLGLPGIKESVFIHRAPGRLVP